MMKIYDFCVRNVFMGLGWISELGNIATTTIRRIAVDDIRKQRWNQDWDVEECGSLFVI
jgi:hypothetical protein